MRGSQALPNMHGPMDPGRTGLALPHLVDAPGSKRLHAGYHVRWIRILHFTCSISCLQDPGPEGPQLTSVYRSCSSYES